MTIAHRKSNHLQKTKWKCDICGLVDFWGPEWSGYSSLAMEDACPEDIPTACSDEHYHVMELKIKRGEFVLPKLTPDPGGHKVTKERVGY